MTIIPKKIQPNLTINYEVQNFNHPPIKGTNMEKISKNNSLTSGDWKPPKFTSFSKQKKFDFAFRAKFRQ